MKQRRDEILDRKIVERMKRLRLEHGHSQEYVMENTRLDIPHFESGRYTPSINSIAIFCRFYGLTLAEFFRPLDYPPKK